MKTLLPIIIICAVVFLLCFLIDTLIKALRPKSGLGKGVKFVRMPRRSFLFGMILLLFPVVAVLFWLPKEEKLLRIGCGVIFAMGILLLYYFFSFSIRYDDTAFEYRDLRHKRTRFTYDQIKDKKSFGNIAELIHKKAGLPYTPKTKQETCAEDTLRQELLVDWDELFSVRPST